MTVKLKSMSEQVIVITGASSGIGLVTARMAAKKGAAVVVGARNEQALKELVDEIRGRGGRAAYSVCDVGEPEQVERLAETAIREFGHFDTWVNNAGISIFGEVWNVPMDAWRRMFETVYWGQVHGSLAAVRHFRNTGGPGAIVNVGSFFGDRAPPVQSSYASAKFAVHGFTDALRQEIEHNKLPISVSLVYPGRIDTPYNEHAGNWMPMQPVHRGMIYPPEAVAEAILWCAEHPKRDVYVGSQSKFATMIGYFTPRLADKIMERMMYTSHQSRTREANEDHERALFQAGYGGHERGTHEPHLLRKRSYYVKATKRPALTLAALIGGGALAWTMLKPGDEDGARPPLPDAGDMAQVAPPDGATDNAPEQIETEPEPKPTTVHVLVPAE
jgi:NAD(P)-dependent dehydrogenase (short-subunit alcohol dehydrogenase family)